MRQVSRFFEGIGFTAAAISIILGSEPAIAQSTPPALPASELNAAPLDLDPQLIEESPVLQRWLQNVPDVRSEIRNDPSFRTRLRIGYSNFPSSDHASGMNVGIEDVFVGETGLAIGADYHTNFDRRQTYGSELRYYVLPLGSRVNIAPVAGYRHVEGDRYTTDGVSLGVRLMLSLSRTGAADLALSQSFVAPGTHEEVGITTLSVGYALTRQFRLSTDLQRQNAPQGKDSRVGVSLEWMP